tara:strand:- start:530 stop:895 length:366 start_codon:yes stop_codon:yes gene_type:complete
MNGNVEPIKKRKKRSKNNIDFENRCIAKKSNGEQCTRRGKCNGKYCGTHLKNSPYGEFESIDYHPKEVNTVEVWMQDINGIQCYIDINKNIYKAEDIFNRKIGPKIVGKYRINEKDEYLFE